ncbi:hypothetical protein RB195_015527 [Necator americanus]|uniref:Uncharacterized protein n=1 Tax=Necator americanus TaxID=51031 RepID=A0ABR1E4Z5_NECAM
MMNDLNSKVGRRIRAAWGAFKSIEDVVKRTKNTRLRAPPFNTTVLPALTYASEASAFCEQEENAISVTERVIERVMLRVTRNERRDSNFTSTSPVEDQRRCRICQRNQS